MLIFVSVFLEEVSQKHSTMNGECVCLFVHLAPALFRNEVNNWESVLVFMYSLSANSCVSQEESTQNKREHSNSITLILDILIV